MSAQLTVPDAEPSEKHSERDTTSTDLLDLLGDEYTRRVYEAVVEKPRGGRAVAEAADVSRPTAYRRLNDLQDAGLVQSEIAICTDGHHRERFEAVTDSLSVPLAEGRIEVSVTVDA